MNPFELAKAYTNFLSSHSQDEQGDGKKRVINKTVSNFFMALFIKEIIKFC
jgi:hypothetical protein